MAQNFRICDLHFSACPPLKVSKVSVYYNYTLSLRLFLSTAIAVPCSISFVHQFIGPQRIKNSKERPYIKNNPSSGGHTNSPAGNQPNSVILCITKPICIMCIITPTNIYIMFIITPTNMLYMYTCTHCHVTTMDFLDSSFFTFRRLLPM